MSVDIAWAPNACCGLKSGKFLWHHSEVTIPAGTLVPRDARDFGSYQLLAKLATGGMAEIYLARPTSGSGPKDLMVVKRILPHLAEDEHFVTMFRDEADLASKLAHKNVCNVLSFGQYAGTWFIAMEYLHGVPLSRMMTRLSKLGKMLDYRIVAGIIGQACEGLHAAHEARGPDGQLMGVVHRDVSPPNIMVTGDGMVKLLDFGIAKARGANSRTRTGTVKGKNAYMSPEQILGKPLDRRSDIFALGVVMYEMLAIRRLFHRDSDFLTFKAITEEPIPDIRDRRPDLPPGMRAAVIQAMARDPGGRFDTAQAFGNAVRNSVATLGGPAPMADLARLLSLDFADEMASRDEILKAADDPNAAPVSIGVKAMATPPPTRPPPIPISAAGEMLQGAAADQRVQFGLDGVPSVMVTPSSSKVQLTPDFGRVLDLSNNMGGDVWMAHGGTDLLSAHRWKSIRNFLIGLVGLGIVAIGAVLLARYCGTTEREQANVVPPPPPADASVHAVQPAPADAGPDMRDTIVACSKFGFYSLDANAHTTVYIDDKNIGEIIPPDGPMTRLPLKPGPHLVKLVGPKGKTQKFKIDIRGCEDTNGGTITW
jgi:serine/threonine protein kinase